MKKDAKTVVANLKANNEVKEVVKEVTWILTNSDKILEKVKALVSQGEAVSRAEDKLKAVFENDKYNISTIKQYKGFISNIIKCHKDGLIDAKGVALLSQLNTVRKVQKALTTSKFKGLKLSDAVVEVSSSEPKGEQGKEVKAKKAGGKEALNEVTSTVAEFKLLPKEGKEAVKKEVLSSLEKLHDDLPSLSDTQLVMVSNFLKDLKYL